VYVYEICVHLRDAQRNVCTSVACDGVCCSCVANVLLMCVHLRRVLSMSTSPTSAISIFSGAPPARPASTHPPPGGTPCICSSGAGAGRGSPPRTPCICSFGAGAGKGSVSLPVLERPRRAPGARPPPAALLRSREARPPALLALAPPALVRADARPPALLASAPLALVLADARPAALLALAPLALVRPRTPCIGSSGAGAGRCSPPRTPCIGS
jgi:hypothetical protein